MIDMETARLIHDGFSSGKSISEISDVMGISRAQVKNSIERIDRHEYNRATWRMDMDVKASKCVALWFGFPIDDGHPEIQEMVRAAKDKIRLEGISFVLKMPNCGKKSAAQIAEWAGIVV